MVTNEELKRIVSLAWSGEPNPKNSHGVAQDMRRGKFTNEDLSRVKEIVDIVNTVSATDQNAINMKRWLYDALYDYVDGVDARECDGKYFSAEDQKRAQEALKLLSSPDPWKDFGFKN